MVFRFCPAWELSDSTRTQITRFLDAQCTAHPFQYLQWAPPGSALRTRSYGCWLEDGTEVRAFARANVIHPATRFLPSHRALVLTRGPVCHDSDLLLHFLERLVSAARESGFVYVDVGPEFVAPQIADVKSWLERNGWAAHGIPRASLRLDLRPESQVLLARFRKTTRHEIHHAEHADVSVERAGNDRDFETFYHLLQTMAGEKRFIPESRADVRHVWHWITSDTRRGVLLLAKDKGLAHGGVLIVRAGQRAWYMWGATQKQLPYSVGHLLQWRAILWAKEAGCTEYDFGGYTVGATDGPAGFKHGFCDHVVQFLPVHRCVLNDVRYERCVSWTRWRHDNKIAGTARELLHVHAEDVR